MGLIFPVNLWYHWSGKRGEFDRRSYSEYCLQAWRSVFFPVDGDESPLTPGRQGITRA